MLFFWSPKNTTLTFFKHNFKKNTLLKKQLHSFTAIKPKERNRQWPTAPKYQNQTSTRDGVDYVEALSF